MGKSVMTYKGEFIAAMEAKGIKYTDKDEFRVNVAYRGDNTDDITITVIFDKDGEGLVALRCWSFGSVPANKRVDVLEACNALNTKWRWVRFYIDGDNDVTASLDAVVDLDTVGEECIQLVHRMVDIYDKAYPDLMRACWA